MFLETWNDFKTIKTSERGWGGLWSVCCTYWSPYNASLESESLLEQVHPLSYLGPYQGLSHPTKVANCFLNRSIKEGAWVLISFFVSLFNVLEIQHHFCFMLVLEMWQKVRLHISYNSLPLALNFRRIIICLSEPTIDR